MRLGKLDDKREVEGKHIRNEPDIKSAHPQISTEINHHGMAFGLNDRVSITFHGDGNSLEDDFIHERRARYQEVGKNEVRV